MGWDVSFESRPKWIENDIYWNSNPVCSGSNGNADLLHSARQERSENNEKTQR